MPGTKAGVLNNPWLQFLASGAGGVYQRKGEKVAVDAAPEPEPPHRLRGRSVDSLEGKLALRRILR